MPEPIPQVPEPSDQPTDEIKPVVDTGTPQEVQPSVEQALKLDESEFRKNLGENIEEAKEMVAVVYRNFEKGKISATEALIEFGRAFQINSEWARYPGPGIDDAYPNYTSMNKILEFKLLSLANQAAKKALSIMNKKKHLDMFQANHILQKNKIRLASTFSILVCSIY